jgi:hypothetical protein
MMWDVPLFSSKEKAGKGYSGAVFFPKEKLSEHGIPFTIFYEVVRPARFERTTYCLGGSRSILLSYGRI